MDIVNKYLEETREVLSGYSMLSVRPRIKCKDGFVMSIQASETHYCRPRVNDGPYTSVEIGYPSEAEELLMEYAEDEKHPTETVYGWVPVDVVVEVIKKHGGIKEAVTNPS